MLLGVQILLEARRELKRLTCLYVEGSSIKKGRVRMLLVSACTSCAANGNCLPNG